MRDVDPVWARQWGLPARGDLGEVEYAADYLEAAMRAGTGRTGIFGLRLMQESLGRLLTLIDRVHPGLTTDRERLQAAFGDILFIHLAREDKLAQAVSMVKAEQTGLWHIAPDGTELERLAPPGEPEYDFARIAGKVAELERHDTAWMSWFEAQRIEPLRVGYESLAADPARIVTDICVALGVSVPDPGSLRPGVARLSDAVSVEWMRRYRRDRGDPAPGR